MKKARLKKKDWTLLAISAVDGEPLTPVQLQKSLFLLGEKKAVDVGKGFYDFEPYDYGPFDVTVYKDAEQLEREGLVRIDREEPGRSWAEYAPTRNGLQHAKELRKQAPTGAVRYLKTAVEWTQSLTFQQLVSAIYEAFPEQQENSVFRVYRP